MNGIVIIDKPAGWTSMDVCAKLRGIYKEKRVGHAGTLDPMATGVLPVFIGKATKAVSFAEDGEKEYIAGLKLGLVTNTQDTTGETLSESPVTVTEADLREVLPRFMGQQLQLPPMFSAIKKDGKKLYELARKGQEVERKRRAITIFALEVLEKQDESTYLIRVRCSKGTYVRTLCHDIGEALGCGGCMCSLRRTMAAGFTLEESITLERAQEEKEALLLPLDAYFRDFPAITLNEFQQRRCCCGNPVSAKELSDGTYRLYGADGKFLALSEAKDGILTSIKNFFGE